MKKKEKVLIIIPAYNEEKNIKETYNTIIQYNKKYKTNFDIIVINDGSYDNTENILKENKIPYISLVTNLGIGGAVQTGYKYALENNYDIAIQFDGDGQHDVNCIEDIIKPITEKKVNMVIGSRFVTKNSSEFKSSNFRRIGIRIISMIIKIKTGQKIYDTTSGFRAIDKNLIKLFTEIYPTEYPEPISTVNALNNHFIVEEVGVNMRERSGGKSSIHTWKNAYYMINVILTILLMKRGKKNAK